MGKVGGRKSAEPLTGNEATRVSRMIGFDDRPENETGTFILILDPLLDADDEDIPVDELDDVLKETARRIGETILWNFWPRMVPDGSNSNQVFNTCE